MKKNFLKAYQDHVLFQWFLNLKTNKKLEYFMDIGSDLDKTVFWSVFATCHSVQLEKNQFTPQLNVVGHQENPHNTSAKDSEVALVTSINAFNNFTEEMVESTLAEINRVLMKNGNFLFSMLVGNPKYENSRNGFYSLKTVYEYLEKAKIAIENDTLISPWPFLMTKETIYPNTANEQTIDVFKEAKNVHLTDDDNNQYTYFVPSTDLLDSFEKDEFACLIILGRKEADLVDNQPEPNDMNKNKIIEEIFTLTGEKVSNRKKKDELIELLKGARNE